MQVSRGAIRSAQSRQLRVLNAFPPELLVRQTRRSLISAYGLTLALLSTVACFHILDPHDPALTPRTPNIKRPVGPGTAGAGVLAKKTVASKNPPVTLVAADATHCDTDEKKFKDTKVGDVVSCVWQY